MAHPYSSLPATSYWRKAVSGRTEYEIDAMIDTGFRIDPRMRVATAGSCFAQRISQQLQTLNYNFFRTEAAPANDINNNYYNLFSAAYGNVYTTTQLRQLMRRAYGLLHPKINVWRTSRGRYLDPFRAGLNDLGFETETEMLSLQNRHLACVRRVFEETDVFIFTLGLTEAWMDADGVVVPVIPGTVDASDHEPSYQFVNFPVAKIVADLIAFIDDLKLLNPSVEVILTVSPVPLIATYEKQHVVVSNMYSKSVLRAAAGEITALRRFVHYFPSYEIFAGHHSRAAFFEEDMRSVNAEGVRHVMKLFTQNFLGPANDRQSIPTAKRRVICKTTMDVPAVQNIMRDYKQVAAVVCDEERLV